MAPIVVGFNRTLLLEPFAASRSLSHDIPDAIRWLLLGGGAVGAATMGIVIVILPAFKGVSPALAAWMVAAFLVQDGGRYLTFKVQKPGKALRSDLIVLVFSALMLSLTIVAGWRTPNGAILAWASGLTVGAAINPAWRPRHMRWQGAGRWWVATCSRLARSLLEDSVAYIVGVQVLLFGLAHLATASEVGTTRAVSSLFSPIAVAFTGLNVWLIPHLASRQEMSRAKLLRASSLLGGIGLLMLAAVTALGPQLSEVLFGQGVMVSRSDIAWAGLGVVAAAAGSPILAAVRVANRYLPVAHSRSVAAALAMLLLWCCPAMQSSQGYLALVAIQGLIVLAAGVGVVTIRHSQAAVLPSPTFLSKSEE